MDINFSDIFNKYCIESKVKSEYENYIYENKTITNTLEHAEQDGNNAEEHLKRAKEYQNDEDELQFQRECRSATKDAVDSTEKYLKVVANMKGVENNTFETENGRKEKVKKTHLISAINNVVDLDLIEPEEAEFMDSFTDKENECYTSHTGLSYGDVTPTYEEAERAVKNKNKVEKKVKKLREKVYIQQYIQSIDFS